MRKIFGLMLPLSLNGGIYQKSQAFLFLIPIACITGFSIWSNIKGVELIFGDLPLLLRSLGYLFACIIDFTSVLCFTLAAVSFRVYSVVSKNDDKYNGFIETDAVKSKSFMAGLLFSSLMVALCGLSYILSMNGGKAGVSMYVKEKYAPKTGLDSLLGNTNAALFSDVSVLKKDAQSDISALKNEISRAEKTISHDWQKDAAKVKWGPNGTYAAYLSAQKAKTGAQTKLDAAQKALNEKIGAREKTAAEIAAVQTESFKKEQAAYLEKEAFSLGAFSWAVNIWTPLIIVLGFFMYLLSGNQYTEAAMHFIRQEIEAKAESEKIVKDEMARFGKAKNGLPTVTISETSPRRNRVQRMLASGSNPLLLPEKKEAAPIGFKPSASMQPVAKQEKAAEPVMETETVCHIPFKADFKPANDTEMLLGALQSKSVAKPAKWLQKRANLLAMLDKELQAEFSTKKQVAEKYGVHPSTVDGLRSKQKLIFSDLGMGEERARAVLEGLLKKLK